jgi:predicted dehydrogenase
MSWRYKGGPGSGVLSDVGSHIVDLAEYVCGPITAVRGTALSTFITERARPLGTAVGHTAATLSDVREPVENEDLATFTATPDAVTQGYRQVLVGPQHPYIAGGLPMDLPSVNYGQNDLFTFRARAFLEQVADVDGLPRSPGFEDGLDNLRLLAAVAESARTGGQEVTVQTTVS